MKILKRLLLALGLLLAIAEIVVRVTGMTDFPVYLTNPEIGYQIAPNQHGAFLNRNHWEFNEQSMGCGPFRPEGKRNVLLLGDSLVLGGNPIDQPLRLGPTMERELGPGWAVWPSAAQSWSSVNEAAYLKQSPQVVARMEWLVWVLNNGDFQGLSTWRSDLLNPRHRPLWQSLYVFEKQVWWAKVEPHLSPAFQIVPDDPLGAFAIDARIPDFKAFVRGLKQAYPQLHILVVWYPEVAELHPPPGDFYLKTSAILRGFAQEEGIAFTDLAQERDWVPAVYRDGIHPSAEGNRTFSLILKRIMAEHVDLSTPSAISRP